MTLCRLAYPDSSADPLEHGPMPFTRRALLGSALATLVPLPVRADDVRVLSARKASLRLEPVAETEVHGFAGQVPGPLFRCRTGEEVKVRLVNQLDEPLTFACQGMRIDNAMDGVAGLTQPPVLPGQSFDYRIKPPDSGLFYYRSEVAPNGSRQLRQGLYGAFIVDEPAPPAADSDILVVLADWFLDHAGQIIEPQGSHPQKSAVPADRPRFALTVNSKLAPLVETQRPGARIRLRLLNAAAASIMFVAFEGLRPLVLAIDGEPCEAFAPFQALLPIGPGARFDVMVDLPTQAGAEGRLVLRGAGPDLPVVRFKTEGQPRKDLPPIASLPLNPLLPAMIDLKASRKLEIVIAGGPKMPMPAGPAVPFSLNGSAATNFAATPLFSVKRGTPITLALVNRTGFVQQIVLHGHHLRLLHDLDDGWDPYWRDSAIIAAGRTKHVAFVADNPGKWAIECMPLLPQATEMVTWFEVG